MSAFAQPKVKRIAVFVKEVSRNRVKLSRRPWDFVDLDFGTDEPKRNKRYVQPFHDGDNKNRARHFVYDDLMIFEAPFPGDIVGPGSSL